MTKPIFKEGFYYIVMETGELAGPYYTMAAAVDDALDNEFVICSVSVKSYREKHKPKQEKFEKITIDFDNWTMVFEGSERAYGEIDGILYTVGEYDVAGEWQKIMTDCSKCSKSVVVVGKPPIEGDYLNEMYDL